MSISATRYRSSLTLKSLASLTPPDYRLIFDFYFPPKQSKCSGGKCSEPHSHMLYYKWFFTDIFSAIQSGFECGLPQHCPNSSCLMMVESCLHFLCQHRWPFMMCLHWWRRRLHTVFVIWVAVEHFRWTQYTSGLYIALGQLYLVYCILGHMLYRTARFCLLGHMKFTWVLGRMLPLPWWNEHKEASGIV